MPTPSSLVCRPSVATRRMVSPALGCFACSVWSADTISSPWLLVRVRSPLSNECRSRENCERLLAVEVRRPGVEVRAGEVVVHRRRDVDVDPADLVDHLLEVREVGADHLGDRHAHVTDDTASASARSSLPPGCSTMYELSLAPLGPSVSRGMSRMRRRLERGVHADHVDARRRGRDRRADCARVVGACAGPERRARRTAARGPPVYLRGPDLRRPGTTPRPAPGPAGRAAATRCVTMPATSRPHTTGATTSIVRARRRAGVRSRVLARLTWLLPWSRWTRSSSGCRDRRPRGSRPCCRR